MMVISRAPLRMSFIGGGSDRPSFARAAGASGGKILGAGNGGFLMLFAPEGAHESIKGALSRLRHVPMNFERLGSRIIFSHG